MNVFSRIVTFGAAGLAAGLLAGCGDTDPMGKGETTAARGNETAASAPQSGEVTRAENGTYPAATDDNQRTAKDGDALVPGTQFNATTTVKCVVPGNSAGRDCPAGVVRNKDGTATVEVAWPDGRSRAIVFDAAHKVLGADTNEADGSARYPVKSSKVQDRTLVTIGPERYEIVDAFVVGG